MIGRWIALGLALTSTLIAFRGEQSDAFIGVAALNAVALSMIFRPGWWTFWMPLGFMEQLASDKHKADSMGPVIVLFGWIAIVLILLLLV